MALGSNQPLTETSTRNISWGKGGRCVRLTTYHHPVPLSRNLVPLNSWKPLRPSGPVMGMLYLSTDTQAIYKETPQHKSYGVLYNVKDRPSVRDI